MSTLADTKYERGESGRPARSQPKIEIGIFFSSRSRFCIKIGEPEPPRSWDEKVGISRDFYPDFFVQFTQIFETKVGINRGN